MTRPHAADWGARGRAYAASEPHRQGPSLHRLIHLLRPAAGDRACDLGCGAGATMLRLVEAGCAEVIGVDRSEGMLDAAREALRTVTRARCVRADAAATGLDAGAFDLVSARHTLHHHPDVGATLREVARLLRPGGRFAFVDEVALEPQLDAWYQELERTRDPSHAACHTLDAWRELIEAAGLSWIVGDAHTRYRLDVHAWLARVDADAPRAEAVRKLLRDAPPSAAERLSFERDADGSVRAFHMPMAIGLAVKPSASPGAREPEEERV